jgi:hypothetical protein
MKTKSLFWAVIPLLLCAGCASDHHEQTATYTPLDPSLLAPTSDRDQNRMYSGPGNSGQSPASPEDIKIGQEIRDLLMNDKKLATPPSNVIASARQGVVTLRGTMPTPTDKKKLVERIVALPGVTRVEDQIEVHWYRPN